MELVRTTVAPAVPTGALKVTIPVTVVFDPPTTDVGETETLCNPGGVIIMVVVTTDAPTLAVKVTVIGEVTGDVPILKLADVEPAATVTVDGSVAEVLLEETVTAIPPVGAAPLIVTVPSAFVPPPTDVGATVMLVRVAGVTVRVAVLLTEAAVAVIVTDVELVTALVVIENVAVLDPAGTVTLAATVAVELLDVRPT